MSKLKENIAQIQAQKGWKATWKKKLFGGIYKALEAAQEDAENREHKFAEEKRILEQQLAEERRILESCETILRVRVSICGIIMIRWIPTAVNWIC